MVDKQSKFTTAIGLLIQYAEYNGYQLTFGDAYRDPRVHGAPGIKKSYSASNSVHKQRLAVDFNLFVDGNYAQGECEEFSDLHEFWEFLGGARAIEGDPNHFSFDHNGRR